MDVHSPKNGINRYWSIPIYVCVCVCLTWFDMFWYVRICFDMFACSRVLICFKYTHTICFATRCLLIWCRGLWANGQPACTFLDSAPKRWAAAFSLSRPWHSPKSLLQWDVTRFCEKIVFCQVVASLRCLSMKLATQCINMIKYVWSPFWLDHQIPKIAHGGTLSQHFQSCVGEWWKMFSPQLALRTACSPISGKLSSVIIPPSLLPKALVETNREPWQVPIGIFGTGTLSCGCVWKLGMPQSLPQILSLYDMLLGELW